MVALESLIQKFSGSGFGGSGVSNSSWEQGIGGPSLLVFAAILWIFGRRSFSSVLS